MGETIYSGVIQVIRFVYKSICFESGSWIRCFGRLTWPRISELIISNFLSKVCLFNSLNWSCVLFLIRQITFAIMYAILGCLHTTH